MASEIPEKNEFLCHLGHEMKTVIAALSGALEVIKGRYRNKGDSVEKALFDVSEKNAMRLSKLANNLLDFAHRQA
ncbi:MAG: histidine kinase dimerization/phospho-acceptor domain-containing protein, partial [bacterium]